MLKSAPCDMLSLELKMRHPHLNFGHQCMPAALSKNEHCLLCIV